MVDQSEGEVVSTTEVVSRLLWHDTEWDTAMQQRYVWLQKEKKKDEKKIMEEKHQKLVGRTLSSAEGGGCPAYEKW